MVCNGRALLHSQLHRSVGGLLGAQEVLGWLNSSQCALVLCSVPASLESCPSCLLAHLLIRLLTLPLDAAAVVWDRDRLLLRRESQQVGLFLYLVYLVEMWFSGPASAPHHACTAPADT